ncbi:MAG TPA: hypothetical protein VFC00_12650 [Micromonosporaceae bacterium]|nr:hypothetical protein [Micromonosporaceae bacterium]
MDHWMDWADDDHGADDLDDLGSADTADLGGHDHSPPDLPDDEQPWFADDVDDDLGATHDLSGLVDTGADAHVDTHVDALVDEPLHDDVPDAVEFAAAAEPTFGADPDALVDSYEWAEPRFPPSLDLGELPEPVDGPPWTDPELLGAAPPTEPVSPVASVDVADLYGYAALDLPAGVDPWATLVDSEDPATAALARWWSPS